MRKVVALALHGGPRFSYGLRDIVRHGHESVANVKRAVDERGCNRATWESSLERDGGDSDHGSS